MAAVAEMSALAMEASAIFKAVTVLSESLSPVIVTAAMSAPVMAPSRIFDEFTASVARRAAVMPALAMLMVGVVVGLVTVMGEVPVMFVTVPPAASAWKVQPPAPVFAAGS